MGLSSQLTLPLLAESSPESQSNGATPNARPEQPAETKRPSQTLKEIVRALPDLAPQIDKLGLTQEYLAFKSRYQNWRKGHPAGAKGEITVEDFSRPTHVAANRGFLHWYPTMQEWLWKRTMSYWISVTFFEGSVFFVISSFAINVKEELENYFTPLSLYGYVAGKVCFFICTYIMCLETVNFCSETDSEDVSSESDTQVKGAKRIGSNRDLTKIEEPFYFWPYRWQTALARLQKAGAGPLPYISSIVYFTAVLVFVVGFATEFITPSQEWASTLALARNISFLIGSVGFAAGGYAECLQNSVFTSAFSPEQINASWLGGLGAFLNMLGGVLFVIGAIYAFDPDSNVISCNVWGVGSMIYAASSSLQIYMWKDEQFGLTFLAVLNKLSHVRHQNPSCWEAVNGTPSEVDDHAYFSLWGCLFAHLCCLCGAVSIYNFNIEITKFLEADDMRSLQFSFNELLPCILAHLMLFLCSAVLRTPKKAPFKHLYLVLRILLVLVTVNSSLTLWEFVSHKIAQ